MNANTTSTTMVICHASWRVGQETLRNSPTVSRVKRRMGFCFLEAFLSAKLLSLINILTAKTPPSYGRRCPLYRPGRTRTLNRSFWRRVLYQLSYWPRLGGMNPPLLCFAMQRVLAATRTKFIELKPGRIVATIFLCCVVSLLAIVALQRDDGANIFLL